MEKIARRRLFFDLPNRNKEILATVQNDHRNKKLQDSIQKHLEEYERGKIGIERKSDEEKALYVHMYNERGEELDSLNITSERDSTMSFQETDTETFKKLHLLSINYEEEVAKIAQDISPKAI